MVGIYVPVGQPESEEDDRRSTTSTVASTVGTGFFSVASRLAGLQIEFHDKLCEEEDEEGTVSLELQHSASETEEQDGDVHVHVTGEGRDPGVSGVLSSGHVDGGGQTLACPDSPHHPHRATLFQVCSRLFSHKGSSSHHPTLKRINMQQVEELRSHGYTVVDNFIAKSLAQQIRGTAASEFSKGRMVEGGKPGLIPDCQHPDRVGPSRGDHVMWLALNQPPADTIPIADLLVALQELQEDLQEYVRLRKGMAEYQVGLLPTTVPPMGVPRHRDAAPDGGRGDERKITAVVLCGSDTSLTNPVQLLPMELEERLSQGYQPFSGPTSTSMSSHSLAFWGAFRIWPPRLGGSALMPPQRSLTGSEASETSDTCSLRSHYFGVAGSTTSSMRATIGNYNDDAEDTLSQLAESVDLTWGHGVGGAHTGQPREGLEWVDQDGAMVLDVAPIPGRLVIFLSGAVEHSLTPRLMNLSKDDAQLDPLVSVTAWFS